MKKTLFFILALMSFVSCQAQQEAVKAKVYGRYVPERKDDFAWENEYAAFRMYGPALKSCLTSTDTCRAILTARKAGHSDQITPVDITEI